MQNPSGDRDLESTEKSIENEIELGSHPVGDEPNVGKEKKKKTPLLNQWHNQLSEDGSLDLSNRSLGHIPLSIFDYQNQIKIIYLQDNSIREMPENFFDDLPYLAWCDLRFNCLRTLSKFSKPHNSLRVLMLQDNKLTTLPYSLGIYAVKLKTIGLRGNPLHGPPQEVLDEGPTAIRLYLCGNGTNENICHNSDSYLESDREDTKSRLSNTSSLKRRDKNLCSPRILNRKNNKDIPNFAKSLYNSVARARRAQSQIWSKKSSRHPSIFGNLDNRTASNITYTNDLWRDIPYDGYNQKELINKSLEEMRAQMMKKFSSQRDKILQRIKDREVLTKWRFETRELQQAGRRPGTCAR